jgi:hypothetical protein
MTSAADVPEEHIRERAYYIWEASGRPAGRDQEFWQQACQAIDTDRAGSSSSERPRRATRAPSRRRSRAKG